METGNGGNRNYFFNDTATTEIYTLSLHDALPICRINYMLELQQKRDQGYFRILPKKEGVKLRDTLNRSEEHTSELQSRRNLVCRLLLEKKQTQH